MKLEPLPCRSESPVQGTSDRQQESRGFNPVRKSRTETVSWATVTGFMLIFVLLLLLGMIAMPFILVIAIILQRRHNMKRAQGGVFVSHWSEYANMEPSPADVGRLSE